MHFFLIDKPRDLYEEIILHLPLQTLIEILIDLIQYFIEYLSSSIVLLPSLFLLILFLRDERVIHLKSLSNVV